VSQYDEPDSDDEASSPSAQQSRQKILEQFEQAMVEVTARDRAPLRCLVEEILRTGVYQGSQNLYKACDTKVRLSLTGTTEVRCS
jgi:hypothetical protein